MPLLNYTTKVPVSRTAAEVQALLAQYGARKVMYEYDDQGRICALTFAVLTPGSQTLPIRLPIDAARTLAVLKRQAQDREIPRSFATWDQAYRVAWRIIKDWVAAQMSLLETEMVRLEQIFLPYVVARNGKTVYELMAERQFLLGPGREEPEGR